MRRLYSTFAGGWPGTGLLMMRLVVGAVVLWHVGPRLWSGPSLVTGCRLRVAGPWRTPAHRGVVDASRWSDRGRCRHVRDLHTANLPPVAFSPQRSPARWRCSDPAGCRSMPGSSGGSASTRHGARSKLDLADVARRLRPKGSRQHPDQPSRATRASRLTTSIESFGTHSCVIAEHT